MVSSLTVHNRSRVYIRVELLGDLPTKIESVSIRGIQAVLELHSNTKDTALTNTDATCIHGQLCAPSYLLRRVVHGILLDDHIEFFVQRRVRGAAISSDPTEAAAADWHDGFQVQQKSHKYGDD